MERSQERPSLSEQILVAFFSLFFKSKNFDFQIKTWQKGDEFLENL